jgi:glycerol-3-phosphate acyltransferase PlsY
MILFYFILFILSYLIGSFPTAYLVVKYFSGKDIRNEGTGNVGAMNTARATGKWYLFLLVMILDIIKGALAIYLSYVVGPRNEHTAFFFSGFGVVLGHCYSLYFKVKDGKFSGGKALSTLAGVLLMLNFSLLLIPWFVSMILPIVLTGNLFLGQFVATLALPVIAYFLAPQYFWICVILAIPIFIKQWPRVIPMLHGKEPKWYWKKRS